MRLSHFALPVLLSANACATYQLAEGSVSYTSSPPAAGASGALSLEMAVCSGTTRDTRQFGLRVGDACTLVGEEEVTNRGRWGGGGTMASLESVGRCWLPMRDGPPVHVAVRNGTYHREGDAVDLVVGGTTDDGRYMTYRFTGALGEKDPTNECDGILNPKSG
jgi:hypothetical protein